MQTAWIVAVTLAVASPAAAQVCKPQDFGGAYGVQLTGTTTISGDAKPVSLIGRFEFDGKGGVSGSASVNFDGFFLGNPVTGTYEARTDCTIDWSLQDDSGAWQHFSGTLTPNLQSATFRQTDPGGASGGTLAKLASQCSDAGFQGSYSFSIVGTVIPMNPGDTGQKVSYAGNLVADGAGNLALSANGVVTPLGNATVDGDCMVQMTVTAPSGDVMKLRGVLVAGGKEILAMVTDPGAAVNARFHVR